MLRSGPLAHLVVLDLTRVRSGPTAVRQLADWGADVVKIEAPEEADTATEEARSRNRAKVNAVLQGALLSDTTAAWVEKLNRAGVPAGPVNGMDQVFADPQVRHLGLAWEVEHPLLGTLPLVRSPIRMPGVEPPRRPTPERGEHTEEVSPASVLLRRKWRPCVRPEPSSTRSVQATQAAAG